MHLGVPVSNIEMRSAALMAEIHLIIRTHSQMIPGQLHEQLNSPWGGCPEGWPKDPCKDVQLAIHRPSEQ